MGKHEDEHLRRFCAARDRGDEAAKHDAWERVVEDLHDRVEALVWLEHGPDLDEWEHEEAVGRALERIAFGLRGTFKGTSMGELVNATKTLVHFACIDVQRAAQRRREREGLSLDDGWEADPEDHVPQGWEAAEAAFRAARDEEGRHSADRLARALEELQEDRRRVVELSLAGYAVAEIMKITGESRDNVYQLRSRGLKDLRRLMEDPDA